MKKKCLALFSAVLLAGFALTACGTPAKSADASPVSSSMQKETRVLIAYFTRAENTVPFDAKNFDADAISSASLFAPGNVTRMAKAIQKETGGTLFSIRVTNPYPAEYEAAITRAAEESTADARPALASRVENFSDYDVVFLGYPNWDYGAPMAVRTFLESYDFSGKTVIPFCAHGTGGLSSSVRQIRASLPESAKLGAPLGLSRNEMTSAEKQIHAWLADLPF